MVLILGYISTGAVVPNFIAFILRLIMFPSLRDVMLTACGIGIFASFLRIYRLYLQQNASSDMTGPQPLSRRYRIIFLFLGAGQITISLGTGFGFGVTTIIDADRWSMYLLSSVILSSMFRQVSKPNRES